MDNVSEPVTVIVTRVIRSGSEAAFEDALKAFIPTALAFPGHLGVHMLRPAPGGREYGAVLKFRERRDWDALLASPEYAAFLGEIEPHIEGPQKVVTLSGLESWFTPLGANMTQVPPRWKMAVVTWIGVSMTVVVVNLALAWPGFDWPGWLLYLVSNALVVVALTWGVMPVLSHAFRGWLLPASVRAHVPSPER